MLGRSSGFSAELNLLNFVHEKEKAWEVKNAERDVAKLKDLRDAWAKRVEVLTDLVGKNEDNPPTLREINDKEPTLIKHVASREDRISVQDILDEELNECYTMVQGINIESTPMTAKIVFSTKVNGEIGVVPPYNIVLSKVDGVLSLLSASLPNNGKLEAWNFDFTTGSKNFYKPKYPGIPIETLAEEHLPRIRDLTRAVKIHLDAYVARYQQIEEAIEDFPEDQFFHIDRNHDLTRLSFSFAIFSTFENAEVPDIDDLQKSIVDIKMSYE